LSKPLGPPCENPVLRRRVVTRLGVPPWKAPDGTFFGYRRFASHVGNSLLVPPSWDFSVGPVRDAHVGNRGRPVWEIPWMVPRFDLRWGPLWRYPCHGAPMEDPRGRTPVRKPLWGIPLLDHSWVTTVLRNTWGTSWDARRNTQGDSFSGPPFAVLVGEPACGQPRGGNHLGDTRG
jgi:hypothetical protein